MGQLYYKVGLALSESREDLHYQKVVKDLLQSQSGNLQRSGVVATPKKSRHHKVGYFYYKKRSMLQSRAVISKQGSA